MSLLPNDILQQLAAVQPKATAPTGGAISLAAEIAPRLDGALAAAGSQRAGVDELCRQIDVFKGLQGEYGAGWQRSDSTAPAPPEVAAAVIAVLLVQAQPAAEHADPDGWALKCLNSALKALDQNAELPLGDELRDWADASFTAALTDGPSA